MLSQIKNTNSRTLYSGLVDLSICIQKNGYNFKLIGSFEDHQKTFDVFDSYDTETQLKIFADVKSYQSVALGALGSIDGPFEDQKLLWSALKTLNLTFPRDLFNYIEADDILEIYRNDGVQIFRNFRFHDICSYNLPDLFVRRWDDLFTRDANVTIQIQNAAYLIFSGMVKERLELTNIPEHLIKENDSPRLNVMKMKQRFFYPLIDQDGIPSYGLAVSKVKLISQNREKRRDLESYI